MTIEEIEEGLKIKKIFLDLEVYRQIERYRLQAIEKQDEDQANYLWCLKKIFEVQHKFVSAFHEMKDKKYEKAWESLEHIQILMSALIQNFELDAEEDVFNLIFISNIVNEYQKIFPYQYFLSRESIVKSAKCSICGKKVSFRAPCGHYLGNLYMGEQCLHEVTDFELIGFAIVTNPFDKYSYIRMEGMEYNYEMVDKLISNLSSPYDKFYVEVKFIKKPEYRNVKRNDLCPCGSGKKYKKCHLGDSSEEYPHYVIHMGKYTNLFE